MKIDAAFIVSAPTLASFPRERLPEVALVGRSNVGKSSLINALVGRKLARTSAAPGKTRLANVYRVRHGGHPPCYLVDLPGYGYTRGGDQAAREFAALTRSYFELEPGPRSRSDESATVPGASRAALLLVDARHPGLENDRLADGWLRTVVRERAIVATKIDKLPRGQRIRAISALESAFDDSVLPVSAVMGEGLDELWKLIDSLANTRNLSPRSIPPGATAPTRAPAATRAAETLKK